MYNIISIPRSDNIRYSPGYLNRPSLKYPIGTVVIFSLASSLAVVSLASNLQPAKVGAAVDMDVSGDGGAAAFDGRNSIATEGDNFCSITDDIAGDIFSFLFEGIVNCDSEDNSGASNQFISPTTTIVPLSIISNTCVPKEVGVPSVELAQLPQIKDAL